MDSFNPPTTLLGLVERYSPSGSEREAVDWLVGRMQSLGYTSAFCDEAGNAVGVMGNGSRQVILLGHIDTVPGEIPMRVDEGVLYGRGAVDAKGALACFVDSIAQVGKQTGWQFVVIGAVEEERNSEGARYAASHYHPDYAIIGEPGRWNRISLGYKGSAWANLTVKRGQVHTASGEKTACELAVEAWLAIQAFAVEFNAGKERSFDQLMPTLRGMESSEDGYAQWARINLGARLPLDLPPEQWYAKLTEIAPGVEIEPLGFPIPAWQCDKNTPLVRALLHGIRAAGGQPSFVYKTGTADLNIVAPAWRCPALVYGPGDASLDHTPHERISLEEYALAVQALSAALRRLAEG